MARAPNPNKSRALKLYKQGKKLIEIALMLDVPPGTVRRWKCEDDWDDKRSVKKNERLKSDRNKKSIKNKAITNLNKNEELTDKQKLFCVYYVKYFNATKAYQKAYKAKYETAAVSANRLLKNDKIKKEIKDLKENKLNRAFIGQGDIFQKYIDIAFSDITDYVEFGTRETERINIDGKKVTVHSNYVWTKDSEEVDGSLIDEITSDEKGVKLKMQNKMKALQWLSEHMDICTKEQKLQLEKLKLENELLKVKIEEGEGW